MFGVSKSTIIVIVMILCILLQSNISNAATYPAGDGKGWGFNMNGWPNGKTFNAGDVIGNNLLIKSWLKKNHLFTSFSLFNFIFLTIFILFFFSFQNLNIKLMSTMW